MSDACFRTKATILHGRLLLASILGLAAAVRGIAALLVPDQTSLLPDAISYRAAADQIVAHGQMVSLSEMPLYPILIAFAGKGFGQLVLDIALSVVSVWLAYALAKEVMRDRTAAIVAGLLTACYPPLIFFSVVGLSETLFIALLLSTFLFWYKGQFTIGSISAVLCVLTKPIFDLFAPMVLLAISSLVHGLSMRAALRNLASYGLVYCLLMAPWWANNAGVYHSFVRLTLGGGITLYAGNNAKNQSGGGVIGKDYDVESFRNVSDPVQRDHVLRDAALTYIWNNPGRFLQLAVLKFLRIWRPWPRNEGYANSRNNVIAAASFIPVLLFAMVGLLSKRSILTRLSPILLFGVSYTAVLMVLIGTIRYRLPLEPFLLILAGAGLSQSARVVVAHWSGMKQRLIASPRETA